MSLKVNLIDKNQINIKLATKTIKLNEKNQFNIKKLEEEWFLKNTIWFDNEKENMGPLRSLGNSGMTNVSFEFIEEIFIAGEFTKPYDPINYQSNNFFKSNTSYQKEMEKKKKNL
eukprot:EC821928.1.p1 GENE.EC821928.1~~EC821928.1.p1  ORF type:complete len:126 (+),score=52.55 EC821928.1:34-378(+)